MSIFLLAFQQESNHLRQLVNLLAERRLKLSIEVNRMEREVRRMKHVEDRFHHVVQREGKNVTEFRTLVRENAQTMEEIKVRVCVCVRAVAFYPNYCLYGYTLFFVTWGTNPDNGIRFLIMDVFLCITESTSGSRFGGFVFCHYDV